ADQLFEFGDACLFGAGLALFVEEAVQLFQDSRLPAGDQLRTELMLPADLRLAGDAGQKVKNRLCLELRRKRPSCAWHRKAALGGPGLTSILVQRQGRTSDTRPLRGYDGGQTQNNLLAGGLLQPGLTRFPQLMYPLIAYGTAQGGRKVYRG